jgi:CHAT domain-containing protein
LCEGALDGEKLAKFPLVLAGYAPEGGAARGFWSSARTHTHPHYWAAFTYVGA